MSRPKAAIMQPTFLPWQGYFAHIVAADIFVFLDDVQFVRRSFHHRNRLLFGSAEPYWISLPVEHSGRQTLLNEARISFDHTFTRKFSAQLEANYGRTAGFAALYPLLIEWIGQSEHQTLADRNIFFIQTLAKQMGISSEFVRSSEFRTTGARSRKLQEILLAVKAGSYISAKGSFPYMAKDKIFPLPDFDVVFHDFEQQSYPQLPSQPFIPNLSVVDAIFRLGFQQAGEIVRAGLRPAIPWDEFAIHSYASNRGVDDQATLADMKSPS